MFTILAIIFIGLIPQVVHQTLADHPDLAQHVRTIETRPRADLYWNQPGRLPPGRRATAEAYFDTMTIILAMPLPSDHSLRRILIHELCHLQGWVLYQDTSEAYAETCERNRP